jgi:hypothetical protein
MSEMTINGSWYASTLTSPTSDAASSSSSSSVYVSTAARSSAIRRGVNARCAIRRSRA